MSTITAHPVVLLVDYSGKSLLPLNQRGLTRTQKSRKQLRNEYPDAALLLMTGEAVPIMDFELGRSTDLCLPKPLDWLSFTGERNLSIKFGQARRESLDETKRVILDFLQRDTHHDEWVRGKETWEELLNRVRGANSHREIFEALHITTANDGLDVFS